MLNVIEGHFISGYGDAEDDPERPIELLPGVIELASEFIESSRTRSLASIAWLD